MAKIKKPPVPAKMYRHFAVVTVALTAALALFAQGENREYYEEQAAAEERAAEEEAAPRQAAGQQGNAPAYGEAKLARRDSSGSVGFDSGPEFDRSFGRGSGPQGGRYSSQIVPAENSENARFTASHLDKLSEEELQRLLEAIREDGITNEQDRMRAIAVMEAASRRRSGHRIDQG